MSRRYTAFSEHHLLATGPLPKVAATVKGLIDRDPTASPLIFDDDTGRTIAVNFEGTMEQVLRNLPDPDVRPRIARDGEIIWPGEPTTEPAPFCVEVTLLARQWNWLDVQPGGAETELRRLIEQGRLDCADEDRARAAVEATDRVMRDLSGDLPGFEETSRMLYRRDRAGFEAKTRDWPGDVWRYLARLSEKVDWR